MRVNYIKSCNEDICHEQVFLKIEIQKGKNIYAIIYIGGELGDTFHMRGGKHRLTSFPLFSSKPAVGFLQFW